MNIARLNTKIVLQKNMAQADRIGNHKNVWQDVFSCHATVSGESGSEVSAVGQTVDHGSIAFTIRYCSETADIDPGSYRVLYNGDIFNITNVDHMGLRKRSIKLLCQKVRR